MSDEKPGCRTAILHLFRIEPNHAPPVESLEGTRNSTPDIQLIQPVAHPTAPLELLQQGSPSSAVIEVFPYKVGRSLLQQSELVFYRTLISVVGKRAAICPKVRLGDVFFVIDFKENLPQYFRIAEKHVDFLLCDPQTMKPIVGIELDDEGHRQRDRKERDEFVKKVFNAAALPLIHIPVLPKYDAHALAKRLAPHLGEAIESSNNTDRLS